MSVDGAESASQPRSPEATPTEVAALSDKARMLWSLARQLPCGITQIDNLFVQANEFGAVFEYIDPRVHAVRNSLAITGEEVLELHQTTQRPATEEEGFGLLLREVTKHTLVTGVQGSYRCQTGLGNNEGRLESLQDEYELYIPPLKSVRCTDFTENIDYLEKAIQAFFNPPAAVVGRVRRIGRCLRGLFGIG